MLSRKVDQVQGPIYTPYVYITCSWLVNVDVSCCRDNVNHLSDTVYRMISAAREIWMKIVFILKGKRQLLSFFESMLLFICNYKHLINVY